MQLAQPDGEGHLQLQGTGTSGWGNRHSWWALCGRCQPRGQLCPAEGLPVMDSGCICVPSQSPVTVLGREVLSPSRAKDAGLGGGTASSMELLEQHYPPGQLPPPLLKPEGPGQASSGPWDWTCSWEAWVLPFPHGRQALEGILERGSGMDHDLGWAPLNRPGFDKPLCKPLPLSLSGPWRP